MATSKRRSKKGTTRTPQTPQIRDFLVTSPRRNLSAAQRNRLESVFYNGTIQQEIRALELAFPLNATLEIYDGPLFLFKPLYTPTPAEFIQCLNNIHTTALPATDKIVMLGEYLKELIRRDQTQLVVEGIPKLPSSAPFFRCPFCKKSKMTKYSGKRKPKKELFIPGQ